MIREVSKESRVVTSIVPKQFRLDLRTAPIKIEYEQMT